MKEISNDLWGLDDNLFIYWDKMRPSYFRLGLRGLFEIDYDIFSEIEYIIGKRKF